MKCWRLRHKSIYKQTKLGTNKFVSLELSNSVEQIRPPNLWNKTCQFMLIPGGHAADAVATSTPPSLKRRALIAPTRNATPVRPFQLLLCRVQMKATFRVLRFHQSTMIHLVVWPLSRGHLSATATANADFVRATPLLHRLPSRLKSIEVCITEAKLKPKNIC